MGRRCEMGALVDRTEASERAKHRAKVILDTLAGVRSVQSGCVELGVGRTRFQDLRQRLLGAAAGALEERAAGRPRLQVAQTCRQLKALRLRLSGLERELRRAQAELDIARGEAGEAVQARLVVKGGRR